MAIRHEVVAVRRMTEEEFDRWCMTVEYKVEFVDGEVIVHMSDSEISDDLYQFLIMLLGHYVAERGLGVVYGPNFVARLRPGLRRCPDTMVLMGPRTARNQPTYVEGGPTVAIEVVSKDSVDRDHLDKLREYEKAGIQEYWLIDPLSRTATFYRMGPHRRYRKVRLVGGRFHSQAIPGFYLDVEWFWQFPHPPTLPILKEMGVLS